MTERATHPNPDAWPVCMTPDPKSYHPDSLCRTPFILRRRQLITGHAEWLWQPDCRHKLSSRNHAMQAHGPDGPNDCAYEAMLVSSPDRDESARRAEQLFRANTETLLHEIGYLRQQRQDLERDNTQLRQDRQRMATALVFLRDHYDFGDDTELMARMFAHVVPESVPGTTLLFSAEI